MDLASLQNAADSGQPNDQYNLGVYFLSAPPDERDIVRARELFELAAAQEFAPAMSALGYLFLRDQQSAGSLNQATGWFRQSAVLGFDEAQYRLAELSIAGLAGDTPADVAVDWFEKSAEQGHAEAQCQLAYSLEHGIGRSTAPAAATRWYARALAKDSPRALFEVGCRYRAGYTVAQDAVRALACFLRSSRGKYLAAGWAVESMRADLSPDQIEASSRLAADPLELRDDAICAADPRPVPAPVVESWSPRVFRFPRLLEPGECGHLVQYALPYLQPSRVFQRGTGAQVASGGRRSASVSLTNPLRDLVIWNIEQRLARLSLLPPAHGEPFTILRYSPGDEYRHHYDFFDPDVRGHDRALERGGQRMATFMIYLKSVVDGGTTDFPDAGIEIAPVQGDGLLFFNTKPDGSLDRLTRHAGRIVDADEKWVATRWIREKALSGNH